MQHLIDAVGKTRGSFANKDNRASKLLAQWDTLHTKMAGMVRRGRADTETSRCAYAVLIMMETGIRIGNEASSEGYEPIKTEFVQTLAGGYAPVKKMIDGAYSPNPDVDPDAPRWARHDGEWTLVADISRQEVQTFGLTTLRNEHVTPGKGKFTLAFTGKKAVEQELTVTHPVLVKYRPGGEAGEPWLELDYYTLYKFFKRSVGRHYKPKDLRTACVNRMFCQRFHAHYAATYARQATKSGRKAVLRACIEKVAAVVGHTSGVCKSAYLSKCLLQTITNADYDFFFPNG